MWALTTTAALALSLGVVAMSTAGPAAASAPTGTPTLTAPEPDATVSANPVLSWTAVSGAAKYRVQISTTDTFASLAYNKDTVARQATPDQDLPSGDLYWRVAATDGGTGVGPYSATGHLTKTQSAGPTLLSPTDAAVLQYPGNPAVFTWEPVPTAKSYKLQIDDASDFIGAHDYTTANASYTLTEPLTVGQPFYWRVQATSTNNSSSLWSETRSFTYSWFTSPLTPPTLQAPANTTSTSITDVAFSWYTVPGAKTYQLQVSPNGDWANNRTIDVTVKGTRYSPPTTINNGSYFWRVRAIDPSSQANDGPWSAEWQFARGWLDRPTLTAPAWNPADPTTIPQVSGSLVLSWTPVPHASSYEIEVSTNINFSTKAYCFTNHTQWTPYHRVPAEPNCPLEGMGWGTGVLYYWHVRGIDDPAGVNGLWSNTDTSDTYRFIRNPAMPGYVAPADNAIVSTPTLSWEGVQGAETYEVTISKSNGTSVSGYPITTYATSYTPTTALNASDGPFSWYVQAVDADGVTSAAPAESARRTFSLVAPAGGPSLDLTTPADASSSVGMPTMTWTEYTGATKYTVHYAAHGFEFPALGSNLPYAGFARKEAPLTPDTYTWWVDARNAGGTVLATSGTRTFTITAPEVLGTSDYLAPEKCTPASPCTAVTDTPTLSWNAAPDAALYEVTIAYDPNFTNVLRVYDTAYTTLTPRESYVDNQAGQAFYWFVRPCVVGDATGCGPGPQNDTANDNASAFQKRSNAIELSSPASGSTVTGGQVTFSWVDFLATNAAAAVPATQEALRYHLEVSTTADFSATIDSVTVDQTTYTAYSQTYPEGPLYWHVQAVDGTGNLLTYSDATSPTWSLTKSSPVPTPTAPADSATVSGVPLLEWQPVAFGAQYTVEVYKNGDTSYSSANRVVNATSKFSAYSPTTGLASGDYVWRVRRLDADGRPGSWSAGRLFTLLAAAPTLTAPDDAAVVNSNSLLFSWTAVDHAVQYKWELSTGAAFGSIASSQTTVMAAWSPLGNLPDGTLYWRVKVLDAGGNVISMSGARTLVKDASAPTITAKSPTSSVPLTGPFKVTFSEPVHGLSTSTFTVVVAGTATTVAGVVSPTPSTTTTTATFTPIAPLTPGQSYTATVRWITDLVGNPLPVTSWTVRASTSLQNDSAAFREMWDRDASGYASGSAYTAAQTSGLVATFTFTGTNVSLIGLRHKLGGYAAIDLDGVRKTSALSFYSSTTQWRRVLYSISGLANTTHTLKVRVLGTKPAASGGRWVYVDAFTASGATYQETSGSIRYTFRPVATASASGGSYDLTTHVTSGDNGTRPYFTAQLKGTRIYVYGTKSASSGKAAIYIDGALRATVSLYYRSTMYRALVYSSLALSNAVHTIRIEVVGTSTGSYSTVGIDYIQTL